MSLEQCRDWILDVAESMPMVRRTIVYGESANAYPMILAYPASGTFSSMDVAKNHTMGTHTLLVEIQFPIDQISKSMDDAICSVGEFLKAFKDKELAKGVSIKQSPTYTFGEHSAYQNKSTYGPIFTVVLSSEDR